MPNRMTGFGRARREGITIEARSGNHKGRDVAVRVPHGCLEWELKVMEAVGESVSRGR